MVDDSRQQNSGPGTSGDYTSWAKSAPPEAVLKSTIAGLNRIAQLPQNERNQFFNMVRGDATIAPLFDDLKTTA